MVSRVSPLQNSMGRLCSSIQIATVVGLVKVGLKYGRQGDSWSMMPLMVHGPSIRRCCKVDWFEHWMRRKPLGRSEIRISPRFSHFFKRMDFTCSNDGHFLKNLPKSEYWKRRWALFKVSLSILMNSEVVSLSLLSTEGLWRGESSWVGFILEAICVQVGEEERWVAEEGACPRLPWQEEEEEESRTERQ